MRQVNPETLTGTLSWCKVLLLNGSSHIRVNKIFTWDGEKYIKILGAVAQTESCLHRQLDGVWESVWRFIMASPRFNTSSIRDKWHRWKSLSTIKRRYFSSNATVWTGWKVVVRFYGMLLLSVKYPRNAMRKTMWRIIARDKKNVWSTDWIPSDFSQRTIKNSSIWQESMTRNLSWLWTDRGRNSERRYSGCGSGRIGKVGCVRNLSPKNQRERDTDKTKRWWILISSSRWYSKIVRKRLRIPRIHSLYGGNQP